MRGNIFWSPASLSGYSQVVLSLQEPLQMVERKTFSSPPLYRRESTISVSLEEKSRPRVHKHSYTCPEVKKKSSYCEMLTNFCVPQTPVTESGKQSPCNGVASCTSTPPQAQSFSTPPTRRTLSSAQFQSIQSVSLVKMIRNVLFNYDTKACLFSSYNRYVMTSDHEAFCIHTWYVFCTYAY